MCQPERWPELDPPQMLRVLDRLHGMDVLKLLGGEPFLREDLGAIMRFARQQLRPRIFQLNSPGMLPERVYELLRQEAWPGLHLRLSLHGGPEKHDARRAPGAFANLERCLELLVPLRKKRGFQLGVNVHVTDDALPDLPQLRRFCRHHGVGFFPGIPIQPVLFRLHPEQLAAEGLPLRDIDGLRRFLETGRRPGYGRLLGAFLQRGDRALLARLAHEGPNLRFPCQELKRLIYLRPDGKLITCGLRPKAVGDLLQQDLATILHSPAAVAARQDVRSCPGCFQISLQLMSYFYSGRWWALLGLGG